MRSRIDDFLHLPGANQVDVRILRDNIDNEIFELEELSEAEWTPLVYSQSLRAIFQSGTFIEGGPFTPNK